VTGTLNLSWLFELGYLTAPILRAFNLESGLAASSFFAFFRLLVFLAVFLAAIEFLLGF
jgi:hypothetical protein